MTRSAVETAEPAERGRSGRAGAEWALARVPEVTVAFWITKVLTTGMGETTSDFLVTHMEPALAVVLAGIALAVGLLLQFRARRYVAWVYWLAVVMVSVFGTMAADVVHIGLGVPYLISTAGFGVALTAVFVLWRSSEKTLSIHSITTRRREVFYWATVMGTFALGTAAGDLTARTLGLGYLASGALFAVLIAVPAVAHWRFGLNATAAFWWAYVVTRPLGASFADWTALPPGRGGLGLGTGPVSVALSIAILGCVLYLGIRRRETSAAR